MTNNQILRQIRYIFDFNDDKMMQLFALADYPATRTEISAWLKSDADTSMVKINDDKFSCFLNGFIVEKRGRKEGVVLVNEKRLNNNQILRKIKIALDFKDDDILQTLKDVNFGISRHELSAFFRKPDHKHFRMCKDQVLRNFLYGLQEKIRPNEEEQASTKEWQDKKPRGNFNKGRR